MNNNLHNSVNRKFVESIDVSEWEVETDTGWEDISYSNKTIEYDVYEIVSEFGNTLKCADDHILFDQYFNEIFAKNTLNKYIQIGRAHV